METPRFNDEVDFDGHEDFFDDDSDGEEKKLTLARHGKKMKMLAPHVEIQELTDDTLKRDRYVQTYTDVLAPRLREIGRISRKLMHLATPDIKLAQHPLGKLLGVGLGMPIETFCSQNLRWFYYHQVAFCDSWEVILGQWASGNTGTLRPTVPDTTHSVLHPSAS